MTRDYTENSFIFIISKPLIEIHYTPAEGVKPYSLILTIAHIITVVTLHNT